MTWHGNAFHNTLHNPSITGGFNNAQLWCFFLINPNNGVDTQWIAMLSIWDDIAIMWRHRPLSHNAPCRTEMCTFLFWTVYCGMWERCIVWDWWLTYKQQSPLVPPGSPAHTPAWAARGRTSHSRGNHGRCWCARGRRSGREGGWWPAGPNKPESRNHSGSDGRKNRACPMKQEASLNMGLTLSFQNIPVSGPNGLSHHWGTVNEMLSASGWVTLNK